MAPSQRPQLLRSCPYEQRNHYVGVRGWVFPRSREQIRRLRKRERLRRTPSSPTGNITKQCDIALHQVAGLRTADGLAQDRQETVQGVGTQRPGLGGQPLVYFFRR